MNRTAMSTKLTEGFEGVRRRPLRFIAMLGVVAMIAAACGSDATTAAAADVEDATTTAAQAEDATTTTTEVESVTTTTADPEADTESESVPAPDAAVAEFTAAFGVADADTAWSFVSARCQGGESETPQGYIDVVVGYALEVPGATAVNISADVFGDAAAMSYDVENDSGEVIEVYTDQPWALIDGNWYRDQC
jgi:hypothetical protein